MTCDKIFNAAHDKRKLFDAPIRIYPGCHPKASIDVFIDSNKKTVIFCCSQCDSILDTVKTQWLGYGNLTKLHRKRKTKRKGH